MARFDFTSEKSYYDDLMGGNNPKANSEIAIEYLTEIHDQPFKPYSSEQLQLLADDIKLNGLMSPLIVTQVPGTVYYEIIAGRNRFNACKQIGMASVPCLVKDGLSLAQRNLILVNSNLMQRQTLLPSERAKAYQMQFDAYRELGVKNQFMDSQATAYKYLKLNNLTEELLSKVDSGEILFTQAYELSRLPLDTQRAVQQYIATEPKAKIAKVIKALADSYSKPCNLEELKRLLSNDDNNLKVKKTSELVIKMSAFQSELKSADLGLLLKTIIANEYDILRMYNEELEVFSYREKTEK